MSLDSSAINHFFFGGGWCYLCKDYIVRLPILTDRNSNLKFISPLSFLIVGAACFSSGDTAKGGRDIQPHACWL